VASAAKRLKIRVAADAKRYYLELIISAFALAATVKDKKMCVALAEKKDKKLRVVMVLPSSLLPGFNISAFALAAAAKDKKMRVALARSQR